MTIDEVRLAKSSDWNDWYEDFVARAETSKILKYVDMDKDGPELDEPMPPSTSSEMLHKLNKEAFEAWEQGRQENAEAVGPKPDTISDLSEKQWTHLTRLQAEYKVQMVTYATHQKAYADLAAWVRSTVDRSYLNNASSKSNLRVIVRELKSSLAPTANEMREEARRNYRNILTQTKRVKVEDWLVAWYKAKLEGERHKIPELEGDSTINDFLTAVAAFDSAWSKQYRSLVASNRKTQNKDGYTLRQLAELFGEEVRSTRAASKQPDGVFAATDNGALTSPCPCGLPARMHRYKPTDCAAVHIAINGSYKDKYRVKPGRLKHCKESLKQAKWKNLIDTVKESANCEKASQPADKEDLRKYGNFVGLTLGAETLSDGTTDSVFAALNQQHPLYNSTILDGGATTHVVNCEDLLGDIREAPEADYVMIGDSSLKVHSRGTRTMRKVLDGADGKNTRDLVLVNVAYVPRFHTNIISAKRLKRKGLWYCGFDNTLRMGTFEDNDVLCRLTEMYDLDIVEYKPVSRSCLQRPQSPISVFNAFQDVFSSFQTQTPRRRMATSRQSTPPRSDSSEIWHLRACHVGPDVLERLVLQTKGVRIKGPTTIQCKACSQGKAHEIISRRESANRARQPFYRVFADLFEFPAAYNGHRYILLITDEFSGMMFSWSLSSKTETGGIIMEFEARIKRHTGASICKIRIDNERSVINLPLQTISEFQRWAKEEGIDIELPPSNTKEPTGGAERPGGVNQQRMRCVIGQLPQELWPEYYRAVVWIHNILPRRRNGWMTPREAIDRWFHQHFRWYRPPNVDFDSTKDHRPDWSGIYAFGCRAYPLNPRYKAGQDIKLFKLSPRAHVGYLVGYQASNLYRIWVPKLNRVLLSRDVRFNEEEFFDPTKEDELETTPVIEYRPTSKSLQPLPQQDCDSILTEFLYEFDENVLGISPEGSNSGVGRTEGAADAERTEPGGATQPPAQIRFLTPNRPPILPTPDPTPQQQKARDASSAERSETAGSDTLKPNPRQPSEGRTAGPGTTGSTETPELQQAESSPAQRSETGSEIDYEGKHEAETPILMPSTQPDQPDEEQTSAQGQRSHAPSPDDMSRESEQEASEESSKSQSRNESHNLSPKEVIKDSIEVRWPPPSRKSAKPDKQPRDNQQADQPGPSNDSRRHRRRKPEELYGTEPTRKSARTPKPKQRFDDTINTVLTTLLPVEQHPEGNLVTFHSIFLIAVSKAARDHRPHRDDLVRLPKRYQDLENHRMGPEFKDAIRKELHDLLQRGTWRLIERDKARGVPLPLKWVFTYKFDQDGYLQRCKARVCVRGDLQDDDGGLETYAATLAAKTFRIIMATAARFDLDIRQFDVGNAFLYSDLRKDQPVYVQLPQGYVDLGFLKPGETSTMIAELEKALYGLRESPLLWYNELSQALEEAGIDRTHEEPCVFTNGKILVLVYVDDILILGPQQEKKAMDDLVRHLQSKYDLREESFQWYLGIRVIRDRPSRKIYLCQDAYIEKIARKYKLCDSKLRVPSIPITTIPLTKYDGQASKNEIKAYQERVGSLMYVAVMTRPDVARAAAQLARFLTNPSPEHLAAADQCIRYLYTTRYLAIVYDGSHTGEALVIASDASFADDIETRRSSQGYVMMLFNGPVVWKAGLQDTITTSTTEAEILSLERTAKESYALDRLLRDVSVDLGPLKIYCDNLQSIRLVIEENQRITTKLRHVDVQNMWLKQEFKKGRFLVEYLKTDQMPADGLTKALPRSKFERFRSMLNLVDIKRQIDLEGRPT
ncbi:reverse transcriptase family protein [Purpureocillium lavendulum]|uniref:Reverse transcriptase family protein n=1 Tax=Purpureocillium lavendulum TaxID=1247861 RepID=A0AB34FED0_9HYPO|nr:reverse transcriptase family protein [Purpureocillium lavendulum]